MKYSKEEIRLAGKIGEVSSIDVEHLISLLDEARAKRRLSAQDRMREIYNLWNQFD